MRERWTSRGLLTISGLLMGLSVTFGHLFGFLAWFCLIPALAVLFRMQASNSGRGKFRRLWLAGLWLFWPMELIVFHWFWYLFPLSFVGLSTGASLVVVLVAWLGLSGMQAVGMALIFPLCSLVLQLWETRWPAMRVLRPLVVAALWTLAEWCQTLFWFGVPWGRLALSQASYLPIMQTVSVWGCYGLTFFLVAVNGYLCLAIKDIVEHTGRFKRWLCTALSFFAVNLVLGSVLLYVNDHREPEREIYAVAVQGNFESGSKWDATAFDIWERYRGFP